MKPIFLFMKGHIDQPSNLLYPSEPVPFQILDVIPQLQAKSSFGNVVDPITYPRPQMIP